MTSDWSEYESRLQPIATLVIWTTCLAVGIAGMMLPYRRPIAPAHVPAPALARIIDVKVTEQARPLPELHSPKSIQAQVAMPAAPPAAPQLPNVPSAPPMAEVAIPTPAIAFAVPTSRPAHVVPPAQAARAPPVAASVVPQVRQITYGEGEGAQPAPDYPLEAQLGGQQGTVVVRFDVAADGHVTSAAIASPCSWPLLNQSALRAVRETWQFSAGTPRSYEVVIQFKGQDQ